MQPRVQPGQRVVAGGGNQTAYLAPNGQVLPQGRQPVVSAVAAEQMERMRQEQAARHHQQPPVMNATPYAPRLPSSAPIAAPSYAPTRAPLGAPTPANQVTVVTTTQTVVTATMPTATSSQERAGLGTRVKR